MPIKEMDCRVGEEISVAKLRRALKGSPSENHPLLDAHRKWIVERLERKPTKLYLGKRRKATNATVVRGCFVPKNPPSVHARIRGFWFEGAPEKLSFESESAASNKSATQKPKIGGLGNLLSTSPPTSVVVVANSLLPDSILGWAS